MQNERYVSAKNIATILAFGLLVLVLSATVQIPVQIASATTAERVIFCNLNAYPGDTITENMTLYGDLPDRTGSWRIFYKPVEGDSEKMNITSWIEVTPKDYTIKTGEAKHFQLIITVPSDASPGLCGATSEDAAIPGHVDQRRTYIEFTDGDAEAAKAGGVATRTGIRIPISVNVLGTPEKPSPFEGITDTLKANILSIAMLAVIVVLLVILLRRRKT
jgi:hypothetical protein